MPPKSSADLDAASTLLPIAGTTGDAAAIIEAVQKFAPHETAVVEHAGLAAPVAILPDGRRVESLKPVLDAWRDRPERRTGSAEMRTLDSIIAHANRMKDADSALFAWPDKAAPTLTAVYDYNERRWLPPGADETSTPRKRGAAQTTQADGDAALVFDPNAGPRFARHRAVYPFPLSDEWKAWHDMNGETMDQADFAAFIEDRIADVLDPSPKLLREAQALTEADAGGDFGPKTPDEEMAYLIRILGGQVASPSRMVELSRGLTVHVGEHMKSAVTLSSGEVQMTYVAQHQDAQGAPLKVPSLFLIGIPVFAEGACYRLAVRLRYCASGGPVKWFYQLYRADRAFDHAFREACARAATETGLPLFYGRPEA